MYFYLKTTFGSFPKFIFTRKQRSESSRNVFLQKNSWRGFPEVYFYKKTAFGTFLKCVFAEKQFSGFSQGSFSLKAEKR